MTQEILPAHSEAKIRLLSGYLDAYLAIISRDSHTTDIHLADVFCGPGSYQDGKEGSPIVIARKLAALHREKADAPRTSFLANDKKKENTESVGSLIQPLAKKHDKLRITISQEDAATVLHSIASQQMGPHEKRFLFVDPFGYRDISIPNILSLLDGGQTELLLFQPCSFMHRFAEKSTPEALESYLLELSEGQSWPQGLDTYGYISHTKDLLQKKVGDAFFVDSFTIKKDPRNIFCLFFFSPHIRGFEKMLDAKWKMDDLAGTNWHFDEENAGGLFAESNPLTDKLEKGLLDFLCIETGRSNFEIYEQTLRLGFRPTHATQMLRSLLKQNKVRVEIIDGKKGAFYLNYDYYASQTRKIQIFRVN